jgi:hypothetical protein
VHIRERNVGDHQKIKGDDQGRIDDQLKQQLFSVGFQNKAPFPCNCTNKS